MIIVRRSGNIFRLAAQNRASSVPSSNRNGEIMKKLVAILLSVTASISSIAPAEAFPMPGARTPVDNGTAYQDNVVTIAEHGTRFGSCSDGRCNGYRGHGYGHWNGNWHDNGNWHGNGRDYSYHRGHYYGYHDHNDVGAVLGGLAVGAIIGGALAQPRYSGGSHAEWCYSRYRSYRASDNTYQPTYGPRRQCQ